MAPADRAGGREGQEDALVRRLYTLAWALLLPLAFGYLLWRSLRQPAYRAHWGERLGFAPAREAAALARRPIWIHAVSVGETRAAMPLVEALARRDPGQTFLLTHATPTGREAGADLVRRLPGRVAQCYLPYDLPGPLRRFLARWQPVCGLVLETEVWPNLAWVCDRAGLPLALVNGRLSERSLRRGKRQARLIVPALGRLAAVVVQTAADASRLQQLGRRADAVVGNLKYDIDPPAGLVARGHRWRQAFGGRPVVLAASTRDGEEALLVAAWRERVAVTVADPLLLLVPRHPQRFEAVAAMLATAFGPAAVLRRRDLGGADGLEDQVGAEARSGAGHRPVTAVATSAVVLGDSMGEMPAWYAAADVTIMGGSLLPFGAQNLIEANAVGCPVVLGPSTFNFAQAAEASIKAGAAVQVADAGAAVEAALAIALDPGRRAAMAAAATAFTRSHRGATDRTLDAIEPFLPPVPGAAG